MASGNDFVPSRESDLIPFLHNWAIKLPGHQPLSGLTVAAVTALVADALCGIALIEQNLAIKEESRETNALKNLELYGPVGGPTPAVPSAAPVFALSTVPPGILKRLRDAAALIKAGPNYTPAMGADLGIIAPVSADVPAADAKPVIKGKAMGSHEVRVDWTKGGHEAIDFESRRAGETAYAAIGTDFSPPFVDNRPLLVPGQPETREIRARYRDDDAQVGQWSDPVVVTVGP